MNKLFLLFCLVLEFLIIKADITHDFNFKLSNRDKNNEKQNIINANLSYNQDIAIRNLYFAYGSYCNVSSLLHWNCKWCQYIPDFQLIYLDSKYNLQVFVGYDNNKDQIVVSFRGTHNIYDWVDDFEARKIPYPGVNGGEVHRGFYLAWNHLKEGVINATALLMDKYYDTNTSLLITGHSLGAALAQLSAIDLKKYANETNNSCEINLYTYGSPRWANLVMAKYFSYQVNENWRIVNRHDMVPTKPPEHFGYHHTWTEVWYTQYKPDLKYKICSNSGEDSSCSYIEKSANDHLWYLGIHEYCD